MKFINILKKSIFTIVIVLIPVNIILLILFYDGNLRYNLMRFIGESNNIITEYRLFRAIESRNFSLGVDLLDKQLDRTQSLSPGNNKLLKSLFENISYSFNSTVYIEDRDHFEIFLKKMVTLYPDIYSLRIWYAKTLENNEPVELYQQLDIAIKILESDSEVYRIGIKNAFINQDLDKLNEYCVSYYENQLGGTKYADIPWVFNGIGLRSMSLELLNGDEKIFVKNNGISLNEMSEYEFLIPKEIPLKKNFYLHIAITDGIELTIDKIRFFSSGLKVAEYYKNDLYLTTEKSFINSDGSILILSKEKPELIEFHIDKFNKNIKTDKIIFDFKFQRLNTASSNICLSRSSSGL